MCTGNAEPCRRKLQERTAAFAEDPVGVGQEYLLSVRKSVWTLELRVQSPRGRPIALQARQVDPVPHPPP